jgi:hypothetical protein
MNHRKDSQHFCHVWLNEGTFEWYISTPKDVNQMERKSPINSANHYRILKIALKK